MREIEDILLERETGAAGVGDRGLIRGSKFL